MQQRLLKDVLEKYLYIKYKFKNMKETILNPVIWGMLIWLSALIFSWWLGRVMWVSWIIKWILPKKENDSLWRYLFLVWIPIWSLLYIFINPSYQMINSSNSLFIAIISWILVWIGTSMANGCASWHAVCWIWRSSIRSIIATILFVITWIITSFLINL